MAKSGGSDYENVEEEESGWNEENCDMGEEYSEAYYEGDGEFNYEEMEEEGDENYHLASKRGRGSFR